MSEYAPPTPAEGFLDPGDPILFRRLTAAQIEKLAEGAEETIVLDWQFVGPDRTTDPAMATRLTVTFTLTPDGTQLDLTHDRLDGLSDRYPRIAEQVGPGWESALDRLVTVGR